MGLNQSEINQRTAKMQAREEVYAKVQIKYGEVRLVDDSELTDLQQDVAKELKGMIDKINNTILGRMDNRKRAKELGILKNQVTMFGQIELPDGFQFSLAHFMREVDRVISDTNFEPKHRNPNPNKGKPSKQKAFLDRPVVNGIDQRESAEAKRAQVDKMLEQDRMPLPRDPYNYAPSSGSWNW